MARFSVLAQHLAPVALVAHGQYERAVSKLQSVAQMILKYTRLEHSGLLHASSANSRSLHSEPGRVKFVNQGTGIPAESGPQHKSHNTIQSIFQGSATSHLQIQASPTAAASKRLCQLAPEHTSDKARRAAQVARRRQSRRTEPDAPRRGAFIMYLQSFYAFTLHLH